MKPIVLYHGHNTDHEFWEDEKANIVFLRVHSEYQWVAYKKGKQDMKYLGSSQRVETLVKNCGCVLSEEKAWEKRGDRFQLVVCN